MKIFQTNNYLTSKSGIRRDSALGLLIALGILTVWGVHLLYLLALDLNSASFPRIFAGVLLQTFLYTGLFITAHDAMHRAVFRMNHRVNDAIGGISVFLYALFSYQKLLTQHWEHHRHPGAEKDPDFHAESAPGFFHWYIKFMFHYLSLFQLAGMAVVFNLLQHWAGIDLANLLLFWIAPALLSTLQLFYFGTYLPHRRTETKFTDQHHSRSNEFPLWLSFITCYHFGYHWEHHEYPYLPWWRPPAARK